LVNQQSVKDVRPYRSLTVVPHRLIRLTSAAAIALSLPLSGCVVGTVAGAAANVATTTVKTGVHVAGAATGVVVNTTGAVVHAATGGDHNSQNQN
jgi:hypothetical protein